MNRKAQAIARFNARHQTKPVTKPMVAEGERYGCAKSNENNWTFC